VKCWESFSSAQKSVDGWIREARSLMSIRHIDSVENVELHQVRLTPGANIRIAIFTEFRRFLVIFADFWRFSPIVDDFRRFLTIFADF
jgi:hypothetical protein